MKYIIKIDGFRDLPSIQQIKADDGIKLNDKSYAEISQLYRIGDEVLIQGSVLGINIDSEYSLEIEDETGSIVPCGGDVATDNFPVAVNLMPTQLYRYELYTASGCLNFELECESFDEQKLLLRVFEVLVPELVPADEHFAQGKLRLITGIQYADEVIEGVAGGLRHFAEDI